MSYYKVVHRKKYLNPQDLVNLFPDIHIRAEARAVWRRDDRLCNPVRKQFKH